MNLLLGSLALYALTALLALCTSRRPQVCLWSGVAGTVLAGTLGLSAALRVLLTGASFEGSVAWAVPGGALSLGIDPLSAVFLVPVFALSALFAVYGAGYLAPYAGRKALGGHVAFYNGLAAAMALVLTARNGVLFLMAWEAMGLTSFFLVAFEDEEPEVQSASRVYLVAMHLGVAFLFGLFAWLARESGSFAFSAFASRPYAPATATGLFALALVGFGTKAGFWPLHVWLPKAHPAAPSHVSALMSGVMVKTGVYGLCRLLLLLGPPRASWGVVLLAIGGISGVLGLLNAISQRDLKALLAYSTGENMGIIALGLGTGVLGMALGHPGVAAAGFAGALLHVWNHGLFKGLLFLGAGSVVHATHTRDLERLGGLAKRLPFTAAVFLTGSAAICALPPLNGLASEWLLYVGFFRAGVEIPGLLGLATLTTAAVLALIGGVALLCFTRAFGIVFLGEPRSPVVAGAHEAPASMRLPMAVLAALCLGAGLFPSVFLAALAPAVEVLAPGGDVADLSHQVGTLGLVSLGLLALGLAVLAVRRWLLAGRAVSQSSTWDCGFAAPSPRMQYTGHAFAEPLTTLFRAILRPRVDSVPPRGYFPSVGDARYVAVASDAAEATLWQPVFEQSAGLLGRLRFLQRGRVQTYLVYVFVTLLALLIWALAS